MTQEKQELLFRPTHGKDLRLKGKGAKNFRANAGRVFLTKATFFSMLLVLTKVL